MTSHVYTSKASRTLPNVIGTPAYLNDDNVGLKEELPEDDGSDAESDAEVYVSGEEDGSDEDVSGSDNSDSEGGSGSESGSDSDGGGDASEGGGLFEDSDSDAT